MSVLRIRVAFEHPDPNKSFVAEVKKELDDAELELLPPLKRDDVRKWLTEPRVPAGAAYMTLDTAPRLEAWLRQVERVLLWGHP